MGPYTEDFDELRDVNHEEMNQNVLPELKISNLDIEAYDTVFIGYPVCAVRVPQAVLSFLAEYDLSGKTVIPIGRITSDLSVFGSFDSREDITFSLAQ